MRDAPATIVFLNKKKNLILEMLFTPKKKIIFEILFCNYIMIE
jgi:hypothetical protein